MIDTFERIKERIGAGYRRRIVDVAYSSSKIDLAPLHDLLAGVDEFDPERIKEDIKLIALVDGGENTDEISDLSARAEIFRPMVIEIRKCNDALTIEQQALVLHLARMELSRDELYLPTLAVIDEEIALLQKQISALEDGRSAANDAIERAENAGTGHLLAFDQKKPELVTAIERFSSLIEFIQAELSIWFDFRKAIESEAAATNDGLHVLKTDIKRMKKSSVKNIRAMTLIENLTKIWIKYVDSKLGLASKKINPKNPYIRFILAGCSFAGLTDVKAAQILNVSGRYFKKNGKIVDELKI